MIVRILTGLGLLALGYYVGREIGRAEPIRKELQTSRDKIRREEHVVTASEPEKAARHSDDA